MSEKTTRREARETADVFASAFRLNPDPMAVTDLSQGRIVEANAAFARWTGYPAEEFIGATMSDLGIWVDPKDREAMIDALESGGEVNDLEVLMRQRGGAVRNMLCSAGIVEAGPERYLLTIVRDITERRRAEEALRESEQKFKDLAEQSITGIYLIQDGVFRYVSKGLALMLGYAVDEMVDKVAVEDIILPEDWPLVRANIRKKTSGTVKSMHYEFRVATRDGKVRSAEVYSTRTRHDGRPAVIGTCLDITERTRVEGALRESRQRFRDLVETLYDRVWEVDAQGRYTYVSPQIKDILGYDGEEVIGRTPYDFMSPEDARRAPGTFGALVEQGRPITALENASIHKDGHVVVLETNGRPFYDAAGSLKGYRGTDRDVTARRRAEQEREKLIAGLTEALSNVRTLTGLLPICASCKKIRNDRGYWEHVESYMRDHPEAGFSHGICPECGEKLSPGFHEKSE